MRLDRGQSSVVGVVLLLGITIVGTGAIVGLGAQAFADTERAATVSQAQHSLTQFDSKAAIVALGESSSQRVELGDSGGGEFTADDDAGWINVTHHNATDAGKNETIYNATLGSVSYTNGDTEIAYQGGGVWERSGDGSVMRSPPEFNYRGATLTLPSIRVTTEDQATGPTTAIIRQANESRPVYPVRSNTTAANENWSDEGAPYGDGEQYANPVNRGNVTVTVQSQFYQGWAEFFRTRTSGVVTVDHERERASVRLVTTDTVGDFHLTDAMDEDGIAARGQAPGHSLTTFNSTFQSDGQAGFNNYDAGFYAESGPHRVEFLVYVPSGNPSTLELHVFYENSDTGAYHEWSNTSIPIDSGPIRIEEDGDISRLYLNLTAGNATHGVNLTYGNADDQWAKYSWGGDVSENATFGHNGEDNEETTFGTGTGTPDEATTYLLARHYVALLGDDFVLNAHGRRGTGGQGQGVDFNDDASVGVFEYDSGSGGTFITYLHVTENGIEVELE